MERIRIANYVRKSKFTGKGESIENQIQLCKEYATRLYGNEYDIDFIYYEDEGYTGKNTNRPAFIDMMKACRNKKIDVVVCYRLDRISRNISDFSRLITELNELEIAFISVRESFDTSSPMGRAMLYIASVFAQLERETIEERIRDNIFSLAKTGRWLGGTPPFGYVAKRIEHRELDGKKRTLCQLELCDDGEQIITTIVAQFLKTHKYGAVVKYLKENNIKGQSGMYMTANTIKDILQNPAYCIADKDVYQYFMKKGIEVAMGETEFDGINGLLAYGKRDYSKKKQPRLEMKDWIIAIGKHKGIIPGKVWVEVQELIQQNKRCQRSGIGNSYGLLSGVLYCAKCGIKMYAKRGRGDTYYYICRNKKFYGADACTNSNINGNQLDEKICDYLKEYLNPTSDIYKYIDKLMKSNPIARKMDYKKKIDDEINKKQKEINRLLGTIIDASKVSNALIHHVNEKVVELDIELSNLKKQRLELEYNTKEEDMQEHIKKLKNMLSDFKTNNTLSVIEKRKIIKTVIKKVEWDGTEIKIFLRENID